MRQLKISQSITTRDTLSLEKYLVELSHIEMVTPTEEIVLAGKIKSGDKEALETLVKANLRFVVSVAKQYQYRGFTLTDLINEGNIGLIRAAQNFDETKGFKFISYAVWWIRQSIMQALNDKGRIVRLPSNKGMLMNKVNHSSDLLAQTLEREPDTRELAFFLETTEEEIALVQGGAFHLSLDAPLREDGEHATLMEQLPATDKSDADARVLKESLSVDVRRCFATMPAIQSQILRMFFGIGQRDSSSLKVIGEELKLSEERVRQIKQKALAQLGTGKKRLLLQAYLSR